MNLLLSTIMQEKKRIEFMLSRYRDELDRLPKGTLSEKRCGSNTYYYLKYRDGRKVVSQYIGKDADEMQSRIEYRQHIEIMIKSLQDELSIANKALEGCV